MTADATKDRQIFISIASYRDAYLPFTIDSALENAVHPDRLIFGLCWQADDSETLERFLGDPRFRIRKYPYTASLGYGWSRAEVQKLEPGAAVTARPRRRLRDLARKAGPPPGPVARGTPPSEP